MNIVKTGLLLGALTGLLMLIGGYFGGQQGVVIAFIFAMVMNFGSYWFSDKLILRMYKAQEVSESQAPELYAIVKNLALKASLPMPKVYVIPGDTPNAFATGRNEHHAVVAVTEGILRILNRDELEGVIAHELAHIKNRDMLIGSIAATLAGAIVMLANMAQWAAIFGGASRDNDEEGGGIIGLIMMAILAPIAATIIQMAISRSREYLADESGARVSQKPYGLAGALEKLSRASQALPMDANPSTAHMFIVNPLTGKSLMNLFSTHPPIEERVARLRSMKPV
jgi:heat shock protein HtpX